MAKKITQEEFEKRFYNNYPKCNITVLEYTAISRPAKIRCNICGKIHTRSIARQFINGFDCCHSHDETRLEKVQRLLKDNEEFEFVKQIDRDNIIVKHKACGNEMKRALNSCLDNPYACKYCDTLKKNNMLTVDEVQKTIDDRFGGTIKLLQYNGQLEKNYYRCMKCGKIFVQKQICLMQSNGCPTCDRFKSMGEQRIKRLLESYGIKYIEQYYVPDLPLQHFDFAVIDDDDNVLYFIEVQGEQHFKENDYFKTPLEVQQFRDNKKRKYCKEHNIPLYEILYFKSKFKNLEILPFL